MSGSCFRSLLFFSYLDRFFFRHESVKVSQVKAATDRRSLAGPLSYSLPVREVGREVVFQCRDEGPRRVRVEWSRGTLLPFPPGTEQEGGRLEMPDIQVRWFFVTFGNMPPFPTFSPRIDEAIKMVTLNLLTLLLANFYCN